MAVSLNIDKWIEQLRKCERIKEQEVKELCNKAKEILNLEENLVQVEAPVTICGDIHGQFWDLLELFKVGGECPQVNYLFLGDYVDRGYHSVETYLLLLAFKVKYPERIILIRGNHESRRANKSYGFYDECITKYGSINVWQSCTETFDCLPIAALIDNKFFCVHGGLSPQLRVLSDISKIERKIEIPDDGLMSDLMWSDPDKMKGWQISPRGAGYLFGQNIVEDFCRRNNIEAILRAHQLVLDGYISFFEEKLFTIWSAPNYCYRQGNLASILEIDENSQKQFKVFEAAPTDNRSERNQKYNITQYFL
ncbi:serine/threonine protein phosphatase 2A (macronuclear) [Tetrahymena thermophila SB210]|uniref:Serine/threonine-protein phosphatase n=1 Tax=Tetrahymena thermophila (strain SB210) TaxID=312017 RepID=I7LVU5_TETTS|nr:serine/threonine protein phosphatase 2A [Tetrahymena thermophila SB210]EAR99840.3 serine/threonine protein phosphatase 2A [Tetrahymena thermophila SB210]|eukprot:XP_001020085.3 serine/threonine protein phosphatase 2A [Tetrahymena thermophila SB210]